MLILRKQRAQSVTEYIILLTFVMATLLVFQKYISRGISGRWKGTGDGLGQERLYDAWKTTACAFDSYSGQELGWYDQKCFESSCQDACFSIKKMQGQCGACILGCKTQICDTGG